MRIRKGAGYGCGDSRRASDAYKDYRTREGLVWGDGGAVGARWAGVWKKKGKLEADASGEWNVAVRD